MSTTPDPEIGVTRDPGAAMPIPRPIEAQALIQP